MSNGEPLDIEIETISDDTTKPKPLGKDFTPESDTTVESKETLERRASEESVESEAGLASVVCSGLNVKQVLEAMELPEATAKRPAKAGVAFWHMLKTGDTIKQTAKAIGLHCDTLARYSTQDGWKEELDRLRRVLAKAEVADSLARQEQMEIRLSPLPELLKMQSVTDGLHNQRKILDKIMGEADRITARMEEMSENSLGTEEYNRLSLVLKRLNADIARISGIDAMMRVEEASLKRSIAPDSDSAERRAALPELSG